MDVLVLFTCVYALLLTAQVDCQLYRRVSYGSLNYRQYRRMNSGYRMPHSLYQPRYHAAQPGRNNKPVVTHQPQRFNNRGLPYQQASYGNYLRQLNQGYFPQGQQNAGYQQFSRYKTGFPLGAKLPGYSPNHSPLPLSAPSLYGYGGYQTDRWGQWSSWSQCSRSCDGGVQERTRNCLSPKLSMTLSLYRGQGHNQGNCPGFGKEFQPCNTKPCVSVKSFEDQKYDARKSQCSRFDDKEYLGQKYVWMPYIREGLSECRLYCMAKGFRMFVELANRVDEGTPCGKVGNEACFSGICSRAKPKRQPVRPHYNRQDNFNQQKQPTNSRLHIGNRPPAGLNLGDQVLSLDPKRYIPLGQRLLQQGRGHYPPAKGGYRPNAHQPGSSQIANSQNQARRSQGSNIRALNGNGGPFLVQNRDFAGQIKDTRISQSNVVKKVITGNYNTREGLKLGYNPIFKIPVGASDIKIQEARPSANYLALKVGSEYLVNGRWSIVLKKDVTAAGTTIRYRLGKGPGTKEIITADGPTTKEIQVVLLYQQGPPDVFFNYTLTVQNSAKDRMYKAATATVRKGFGNVRGRKARPTLHWSVAGWTKCSKPCGGGEQQLNIRCVAVYPSKRTTVVKSSYCHTLRKPPQKKRVCNMHVCKPSWLLLPWKPCSKTCGKDGFQTRDVRCVRTILTKRGKAQVNAPFYECGPRPAIRKQCPFVACYNWKSHPWSECSRSCDKGVQTRKSSCVADDTAVEEQLCDQRRKPERVRVCNLRPCKASWFIGQWSKCNKLCDEGVETRLVFCAGKDGSSLSESFCENQLKPETTRVCQSKKCSGVWFASNWTQCSSDCGAGEHSRMVLCLSMANGSMNQVSEINCDLSKKPASTKACDSRPCNPKWFTTEWSHCSRTCGRGIRTRQINCMLKNGQVGRGCQVETRPNSAMICQVKSCENEISDEKTTVERNSDKKNSESSVEDNTLKPKMQESVPTMESHAKLGEKSERSASESVKTNKPTENLSNKHVSDKGVATKGFAAAETIVARPFTKIFKVDTLSSSSARLKTTIITTQKSTPLPTTVAATTELADICQDSFKRAYCSVILRIGFCKFTTYRKRCCRSCEKGSIR